MIKEEFLSLLDRYLEGTCSAEEQHYFDQFYNTFQQNHVCWNDWALTEKERIKLKIYESITRSIGEDPHREHAKRRKPFSLPSWRVAASVALFAAVTWMAYKMVQFKPETGVNYITESTGRGQRSTLTLSDGSVMRLNVASSVSFPEQFTGDSREVVLQGEAFFDVAPDASKPFVVRSGSLNTTVLGTSFNIRAYPGEKETAVTVKTGKVNVACDPAGASTAGSMMLIPGEQLRYDLETNAWQKRKASLEKDLAWTQNILYLDDTPLREAMAILERWYNIEIELENEALGDCLISGKYKSDRLMNILDGFSFMQGIAYRFAGDRKVILTGKPCKQ